MAKQGQVSIVGSGLGLNYIIGYCKTCKDFVNISLMYIE